MYQRASGWTEIGKNGGVQLLHLHAMRTSTEYNRVRRPTLSPAAAAAATLARDATLATGAGAGAGAERRTQNADADAGPRPRP